MQKWLTDYIQSQKRAHGSIPTEQIETIIYKLKDACEQGRNIFIFGNGGSASNASHFATDLGKSASNHIKKNFRIFSLSDNVSWITALGNDISYDEIFAGQLKNFGKSRDIAISISVSGNSPNCVKAIQWAKDNDLSTIVLVGANKGKLAEIADHVLVIDDTHYGRVEDAQMSICHMICYAFVENTKLQDF